MAMLNNQMVDTAMLVYHFPQAKSALSSDSVRRLIPEVQRHSKLVAAVDIYSLRKWQVEFDRGFYILLYIYKWGLYRVFIGFSI